MSPTRKQNTSVPTLSSIGFKCAICSKSFAKWKSLRRHGYVHSSESHTCDVCGRVFKRVQYLTKHRKTHDVDRPKFICSGCGTVFLKKEGFEVHVGKLAANGGCPRTKQYIHTPPIVEGVSPSKCEICDKQFRSAKACRRHCWDVHENRMTECFICKKTISSKVGMTRHLKTHDTSDNVQCHLCEKVLVSREIFDAHLKSHECHICGIQKRDRFELMVHYVSHDQEHAVNESHSSFGGQMLDVHSTIGQSDLRVTQMRKIHPFRMPVGLGFRTLPSLDPNVDGYGRVCERWLDWMDTHATISQTQLKRRFNVVYLAAAMGFNFEKRMDIKKFFQTHPEEITLYWGQHAQGRETIANYHFHGNGALSKARSQGQEIVIVNIWKFEGEEIKEKKDAMMCMEAKMIEIALIDMEYAKSDGNQHDFLNFHRQSSNMSSLSDGELRHVFRLGVSGVNVVCCLDFCDQGCGSLCHPDWDKCSNVEIGERMDKGSKKKQDLDQATHTAPRKSLVRGRLDGVRPSTPDEIQKEVERRLVDFRKLFKTFDHQPWHVYIALLLNVETFPGTNVQELLARMFKHREDNLSCYVYVGKSGSAGLSGYHTLYPAQSSIGKLATSGLFSVLEICHFKVENLEEAEKLEALIQVHLFLQSQRTVNGIRFNVLNGRMEWDAYLRLTREEKMCAIDLGLQGVPPISVKGAPTLQLRGGLQYPVDLQRQANLNKVSKIEFGDAEMCDEDSADAENDSEYEDLDDEEDSTDADNDSEYEGSDDEGIHGGVGGTSEGEIGSCIKDNETYDCDKDLKDDGRGILDEGDGGVDSSEGESFGGAGSGSEEEEETESAVNESEGESGESMEQDRADVGDAGVDCSDCDVHDFDVLDYTDP